VDGSLVTSVSAAGFSSDLTDECSGVLGTPDLVASFTAPEAGAWELAVDESGFTLWAWRGTCDVAEQSLGCSPYGEGRPALEVALASDETVYLAGALTAPGESLAEVRLTARRVVCGDGVFAGNEECDDGNTLDGDGCSATCKLPGEDCLNPLALDEHPIDWDGTVWLWSSGRSQFANDIAGSCGGAAGPDVVASFTAPRDGRYQLGLGGAGADGGAIYVWVNACGAAATESVCVDVPNEHGVLIEVVELAADEAIYVVADGSSIEPATPITLSAVELVCGDGRHTNDEACDDGNTVDGDGCSAACRLEPA
jgi:cysteine-rich repeat protein